MADTLYEVIIDSTANDLDGTPLGASSSFSFETDPVQLTSTQPQNGKLYVNPSTEIP